MTLWLARHAQPLVGAGVCYGARNIAADTQATREAAQRLAQALPVGMDVACSPLSRCTLLAQALQALRPDLATRVIDPRLAEMDFGLWEGLRWDDIGQAALDAWTADFARHRPGGGECVAGFMARVGSAFDSLRPGATTLWITHAGVIRAATLLARGVRQIAHADEWPAKAPGYGEYQQLALEAPGTPTVFCAPDAVDGAATGSRDSIGSTS